MHITRRYLTMAGALALGSVGLWRSSLVVAASADEAAVAQAVEALRKAILEQDKTTLEALTAEQLSYGHSGGRVETKTQFIEGVMTRKALLKSLTLSDHTIAIVGNDAIARHTWASESETDGKLRLPIVLCGQQPAERVRQRVAHPARVEGHAVVDEEGGHPVVGDVAPEAAQDLHPHRPASRK